MGSSTTCYGGWRLADQGPGPLPRQSFRLSLVFVGVVLAGLGVGWLIRSADVAVAQVGRQAPDFTVPLIGGGEFSLSEQLDADDRPMVLNLWASWCIPCRAEMPRISAFAEAYPEVKVLGVAVDDTEVNAERFAGEIGVTYDLAFGDETFEASYPLLFGKPVTYVIGPDGVVDVIWNGVVTEETLADLVFG